jgi:hypothetical protein
VEEYRLAEGKVGHVNVGGGGPWEPIVSKQLLTPPWAGSAVQLAGRGDHDVVAHRPAYHLIDKPDIP